MKRNITRILVILAIILNISFLCSCVPSVTKVRTKMNKATTMVKEFIMMT